MAFNREDVYTLALGVFAQAPSEAQVEELLELPTLQHVVESLYSDYGSDLGEVSNEDFPAALVAKLGGDVVSAEAQAKEAAWLGTQMEAGATKADVIAIAIKALGALEGDADAGGWAAVAANLEAQIPPVVEPEPEPVPGETIMLSAATDIEAGTENNDQFLAYLSQNPMAGGVSNSLSSADQLDGGEGSDSLFAQIVPEFFGASGNQLMDIQPSTRSIETVEVEARDGLAGDGLLGAAITLDAKDMYGVQNIGSKKSDGDLVIENLNTLANDGVTKRNTSDMTITMDHTDNTNSDGDSSDLTVYFDDNYLVAGEQSEFSIQLRIVNNFQLAENEEPLSGFQTVNFSVGDQDVVVDITEATGPGGYQLIADAINAELAELGISGVQASTAPARTSLFSDDVPAGEGYLQGQLAGEYLPVNIVSTTEPLEDGPIELESNIENFDGLNTWVEGDATTTDNPISVNAELTKVGRGGDGGDLMIGAKSLAQGIEVFNVTVMGEDHLPNNLGTLSSTGSDLHTINIASEAGLESHASLEIRNGFGQGWVPVEGPDGIEDFELGGQEALELVDASAFQGDLLLGTEQRIIDLGELVATGGGDVTYNAVNTAGRASADSITQVTTGAGDDTIDVLLLGESNSGSTPSSTVINTGGGNDTVVVDADNDGIANAANVTTGAGEDVVYGNAVNLTANTGAGNDVIYAENTGDMAYAELEAGDSVWAATSAVNGNDVSQFQLLHNRDVVVTLGEPGAGDAANGVNGFETTITVQASDGYLTTERDLYEAVARGINEDQVLGALAEASVDSNGHLQIQSLVDGEGTLDDAAVEIAVQGDWAGINNSNLQSNIINALREEYNDSDITESDVQGAYDATEGTDTVGITNTTGTDSVSNGGTNRINAGTEDDVIVLSSDAATTDTILLRGDDFGTDSIVHFEAGAGGDVLNFAGYGVNGAGLGSTDYAVANDEVNVVNFSAGDFTDTNVTFDNLDAANVKEAIGTAVANGRIDSIIMVQNGDNAGEYKAFDVNSANNSTDFSVDLVGVLDFGETQNFDAANFA